MSETCCVVRDILSYHLNNKGQDFRSLTAFEDFGSLALKY